MGALDFNIELNKHLLPFLVHHRRFKIIHGGRGSSKSHTVAVVCAIRAMEGKKIACLREFQGSIKDSVYSIIKRLIEQYEFPGFTYTGQEIRHESGGLIVFYGFARHSESIKGLDNFHMAWIEEAQTISEESLRLLTPTFRAEKSEMWFTLNAKRVSDPISQRFLERKLPNRDGVIEWDDVVMRAHINYTENSMFPDSMEIERNDDYERLDRALYNHIWLGMYNDSIDFGLIKAEWIDAAIDAHLKWRKQGMTTATHDPADSGDARATLIRQGNVILKMHTELKKDINQACEEACDMAKQFRASAFTWDATGCGLALRKQITDYFPVGVILTEFQGGATPQDPKETAIEVNGAPILNSVYYKNLRAQKYYELSERFRKTYQAIEGGEYIDPAELISISSDAGNIQQLKSELTSICRNMSVERTFQLLSKQDMKNKLKVESPNLADCLMMSEMKLIDALTWSPNDVPDLGII